MKKIIIDMVLIIFPLLIYLVFSCYNVLHNQKMSKTVFIITVFTSLYVSVVYDLGNTKLLLFCNIPILLCYFKKEKNLGLILSIIVTLVSYFRYDVNIYVAVLKHISYFMTYILLYKRKEFNYLFLKITAIIQGLFVSFEYFMITDQGIDKIVNLFGYILVIYVLTFVSLYLLKLANNVGSLYGMVDKINKDNQLKDSLFKLTHEIKNPIAVCKGYLDMINLSDQEKSKRYIGIIKSEIDRSLNVIADFMDYTKIKIKKEIFDIVLLLDEVYEAYLLLMSSKRIKFNYHHNEEEIYLWGDYDRLKQVFINIIKNSIESITDNGIIDIDISLCKQKVVIIISDNGIGMTKEEMQNIKEMFYTTKSNGTGLGIALSNEIVLAHNGIIEYESIKNVGTKCIVTLPVEE